MQSDPIQERHASWSQWADFLRRWGLKDFTVWLLEAGGPLNALGAQAIYFGGPLFLPKMPGSQMDSLARLLEDGEETRRFTAFLREGLS